MQNRLERGRQDVRADYCAAWFAPTRVVVARQRSWRAADDVYQVGMLMAALLCGYAHDKLLPDQVRTLHCSPHLKAIVQRTIGERRKRFKDAAAMLEALTRCRTAAKKPARLQSLDGKVIVFTGGLSIRRQEATRLAERAGATVKPKVGGDTDVVVVGAAAPDWKAENKGQKLLDVDREAELGHDIVAIAERQFRVLARKEVRQ